MTGLPVSRDVQLCAEIVPNCEHPDLAFWELCLAQKIETVINQPSQTIHNSEYLMIGKIFIMESYL